MIEGFKILDHNDVSTDVINYLNNGTLRGCYLGFPMFNEKYTMALPGCTDWTGSGGSGKSEFLLENLVNTSLYYGWKHLVYVPDVGTKEEMISILIHKLTGKTFDKRYKNIISEQEVYKWIPWVTEHFKILYKEDKKKKITPYQFWDLFIDMHKKDPKIKTSTIDSWKDMKRYVGRDNEPIGRDDLYLEDLKGGTTWFDSGKCMITVNRVDGTNNEVEVIVTKAKPGSVGSLGKCTFFFDKSLRKFY